MRKVSVMGLSLNWCDLGNASLKRYSQGKSNRAHWICGYTTPAPVAGLVPHGCTTLSRCLVLARPLAPLRIRAAAAANRRTAGPEAHLPLALPFRCASAYPARAARPEAPRSYPIFLVWIETPGPPGCR